MSELVDDLLNFFERREGQTVGRDEIEEVMQRAAARIEELERLKTALCDQIVNLELEREDYMSEDE